MTLHRSAAVALAACAASLSLTACSAGITSASTATTSPPAPTRTAAAASSSSSAGRMLQVTGPVGSCPVPAGAKVAENIGGGQQVVVMFSLVTPAKVSSFYAQALPKAGYTISANSVISEGGDDVALIQFTGHGVKGNIDTQAKVTGASLGVPGLGRKNVTAISLSPK
jgi:hypothetical protein